MKALNGILPAIFGISLFLPVISTACHIEIKALKKQNDNFVSLTLQAFEKQIPRVNKNNIKPGDIVSITVTSIKEHRNCSLRDDDYSFEVSDNATLLNNGTWTETTRGVFTNTYKIRVNIPGLFTFRVYRECNKKGISEETFSYQVTG